MTEPIELKFSLNTVAHLGFKVCFGKVDPKRRWPKRNLSESSLPRWAAVGIRQRSAFNRSGSLRSPSNPSPNPPNWIQTNLAIPRQKKLAGLIES